MMQPFCKAESMKGHLTRHHVDLAGQRSHKPGSVLRILLAILQRKTLEKTQRHSVPQNVLVCFKGI